MDIKQLAKQFIELVDERDFIVEFNDGYNERCYEIDDIEIPQIIAQVPKEMMSDFNELINNREILEALLASDQLKQLSLN